MKQARLARTCHFGLAWMGLFLAACTSPVRREPANAILITIDTIRPDHLEPYGYRRIRTPALNQLASDGALFRNCIAQAPLTLPSHCSILTSQWPRTTGVRDQAGFVLTQRPTLASALRNAGFQTAAMVGSSILNSPTGLDQGFDTYVNVTGSSAEGGTEGLERRGDRVMADALKWIETPGRARFFVWIHLFDPHVPYAAPEPYGTQYASAPYDGEIAFVDFVIARLLSSLAAHNLYENTLIAVAGDHGESLGEHGEETHGMFVYDATVRVPLIVKFPGARWKGRVIDDQVRGIDIAPTILEALGIQRPGTMQGQSLLALLSGKGGTSLPAYSETYYPYYHFDWSPLISLRTGKQKYIRAPKPELYDLEKDPGETTNLAATEQAALDRLSAQLSGEYSSGNVPGASTRAPVDSATLQKLKSLGYIGAAASTPKANAALADPKDKIRLYTMLEHGLRDGERGRLRESNEQLRKVLDEDDRIVDAHLNLGVNLVQMGDTAGAVSAFRKALAIDPRNAIATYNLALAYARVGKWNEAITGFARTLELEPRHEQARLDLGRAYEFKGELGRAAEVLEHAVAQAPDSAPAHYYLSRVYMKQGRVAQGRSELAAAERLGFSPQP